MACTELNRCYARLIWFYCNLSWLFLLFVGVLCIVFVVVHVEKCAVTCNMDQNWARELYLHLTNVHVYNRLQP